MEVVAMLKLVLGVMSLVLLVPAIAAAQATPTPPEAGIPPLVWELIAFTTPDGVATEVTEPLRYTVQFLPDGQLTAKLDCNQGGGGYTAADGALEIGPMRTTLALCEEGSHGDVFTLLLSKATAYAIDEDGFLLLSGDEGTLRLRPALLGVVWEWQEFAGGDDTIVRPEDPARYTVEFLPENRLTIRADCNRAMGTYTLDAPRIDLKIGGVTRAMCPPGSLMDRFLKDLDEVSSHVFRDGGLFMALPVDSGILEFQARYVAPEEATPAAG
jgi:heat shock protein HslJ